MNKIIDAETLEILHCQMSCELDDIECILKECVKPEKIKLFMSFINNMNTYLDRLYAFYEELPGPEELQEIDALKIIVDYCKEENKLTREDELTLKLRYGVEI